MRRSSWMTSGRCRWVRICHMRIASSRSERLKAWSGAGLAGSPSCMHGAWETWRTHAGTRALTSVSTMADITQWAMGQPPPAHCNA